MNNFYIKDEDAFLSLERRVVSMDRIATRVEPVAHLSLATSFDSEEAAQQGIEMIKKESMYDTSKCVITSEEIIRKELKDEEDKKLLSTWNATSEDMKRAILGRLNEEDRKDFLKRVNDESCTLRPKTDEELIEDKINATEKHLGVTLTKTQRKQLRERYMEENENGKS